MEKGKPGRKRKLAQLTEEEYKQISLWSGDGLNESQIATLLNVNISTITREKKRNEQFAHAIKKGKYKAVQLVANKVFQNAMEGKETSAIFFLKNRDPDNWADRQEINYNLDLKNVLTDARSRIIDHRPSPARALPKRAQALSKNAQRDGEGEGANE